MNNLPPIEQLQDRPIGRVLMKMGLLTREKVHQCLEIQKQRQKQEYKNVPLAEIFVELGLPKFTARKVDRRRPIKYTGYLVRRGGF
jgi:hypothetical protein